VNINHTAAENLSTKIMDIKDHSGNIPFPKAVLFDWHGTVADTVGAMYNAFNDMLKVIADKGEIKTFLHDLDNIDVHIEDKKLIKYIHENEKLHPKIVKDAKVSRTDLFNHLFKTQAHIDDAHNMFDACYAKHSGEVTPMEEGMLPKIEKIASMGIKIGLVTNRNRTFIDKEIMSMENGSWKDVFDVVVASGEGVKLKPSPEPLEKAIHALGLKTGEDIWYVGDSKADIDCANATAPQCTSIFYNGAKWEKEHLMERYQPKLIISDLDELVSAIDQLKQKGANKFISRGSSPSLGR
jgi:phosphoglycolate phosphatase